MLPVSAISLVLRDTTPIVFIVQTGIADMRGTGTPPVVATCSISSR
jgi:hypothetical protein